MIGLIATLALTCQPAFPITDVVLSEDTTRLTVEGESTIVPIADSGWSAASRWNQGELAQLCGHTLTNLTTHESVTTL